MACKRRLEAKVAVVTGAASGIGQAIAYRFASEGAKVTVVDIDEDGGERTVGDIRAEGGSALFVKADVANAGDVQRATEAAVAEYGRLDILVNNAAIELEATIEETTERDWDHVAGINLRSVFLCSKSAIPYLRARSGGAIVNIASVNGLLGIPRHAAYNAAKGAVIALTRQLAVDYGPLAIRVNCVCPGEIDTPMTRRKIRPTQLERHLEVMAERCHLRRVGTPDDIASAVLFLASDEASWITGAILPVDGGFSCGWCSGHNS